jgi:hypothetical protein
MELLEICLDERNGNTGHRRFRIRITDRDSHKLSPVA